MASLHGIFVSEEPEEEQTPHFLALTWPILDERQSPEK